MKKVFTTTVSLLLALMLICGFTFSVSAAGKVTYSEDSDKFIFEPGSKYSPTDLFTEYKGLMPGDSVKQEITVRNDSSNGVKVKLYVRSKGAHADSVDFLSKLHLTVAKSENNEMAYMFNSAADQTDGMTDWVYLGTLYSGGEVNLILNLDIPIELGDEYQEAIGAIDWEFKAEELPIDPDDPKPPQTGDNFKLYLFAMLGSVVGVGLIFVLLKRRKTVTDD
jgi:LPXTG-motif cell wall-anchored protein